MNTPKNILKKFWGYEKFRYPQEDIISNVLNKKTTIALLPTGIGKSLCYQLPTLLSLGICLVISPLISLMKDQVESLQKKGIKAITISGALSQNEIISSFDNLKYGNYHFLYLSPERLETGFIKSKLKELSISIIAIDEAHCISEWGHDFRPSYRNIKQLKSIIPDATIIALTATATKKVIKDIQENLGLEDAKVFRKSFLRSNISYQIEKREHKKEAILKAIRDNEASAIIYVNSRIKTEEVSQFLNRNNISSTFYHGGMSKKEKDNAFNSWMLESKKVMVATNAFGMGIDKGNVTLVMHLDLPRSIENFSQESGRAGRDGSKAKSLILYNDKNIQILKNSQYKSIPSINFIKQIYSKLHQNFQVIYGELPEDNYEFNLIDFCKKYNLSVSKTSTSLQLLKNYGIITLSKNYNEQSKMRIVQDSSTILSYRKSNKLDNSIFDILLRSYDGMFQKETKIDEFWIAKKVGLTSSKLIERLNHYKVQGIIDYHQKHQNSTLSFLQPREDHKTINRFSREIKNYLKEKVVKTQSVIDFIENDRVCRNIQLLSYFGERKLHSCGRCDVCLRNSKPRNNPTDNIKSLFSNQKELTPKEITELLKLPESDILIHLQHLLSEEVLGIKNGNKFYLK